MTYSEIAKFCNLPIKAIVAFHRDGVINIPPKNEELLALRLIMKMWGRDTYIKMQLAGHTKQKRRKLADTAEMSKPQSYAYNRLLLNRVEQHKNISIRSLTIQEVAEEINYNYKVPLTRELLDMVKRMRWQVYKVDVNDPAYLDKSGHKVRRSDLVR